jgi:hypothetical protein
MKEEKIMKNTILKTISGGFIGLLILLTEVSAVTASNFAVPGFEPTNTSKQLQNSISLLSEPNSPDILQSAYGGGTAVEFERRSTFSFNAIQHSDGNVTGTLIYMFRDFDLDFKVHMNVDCLIIEGNRAKLSGLITKISANIPLPPLVIGTRASMQVEDNGTANADLPDKYSDFHFFQATCADENEPYIPIDGNIVVIP